eukprot:CAMPEP_0184022432 /NCGR_PEP_ID=MMETSP0954-20121128/10600_1 /TAXON_ID=627963 /ORGANISM="Aplanochytrium sp, Strain PBS07" /LENGTH=607 /DNA_ID=CAMNT_0026304801 /DNA_START=199 /DNA_END=2022 /DNA_ORIENTATION=-
MDLSRRFLVTEALKKPSQKHLWQRLFEHDARILSQLSPPKRIEAQFALLLKDVEEAKYPRKSAQTLSIVLALVEWSISTAGISCTRQLLGMMLHERVGVFYKLTYETFAKLELLAGYRENAYKVLLQGLRKNVYTREDEVKNVFERLKEDLNSEKTLTFSNKRVSRGSGNSIENENVDKSNQKTESSRLRSAKPTKLRSFGLRTRAVRVKKDSDTVEIRSKGDEPEEKRNSNSTEDFKSKIGDLSYITSWKPEIRGKVQSENTQDAFLKRSSVDSVVAPSSKPTPEPAPSTGMYSSSDVNSSLKKKQASTFRATIKTKSGLNQLLEPKNIFQVNGNEYLRLAVIGRGGSSKVFKVLALEENEPKIYALKRIKLNKVEHNTISCFKNEIRLMESLHGQPNIIQIIDSEVNIAKQVIYVIMEFGEIDLNKRLTQKRKENIDDTELGVAMVGNLSVNFIRLIWVDMLQAVYAVHEKRIVHGDLKPANFLFVKGVLKLIDFGIAKEIANDTVNIVRDTQVGTINFMSPEAIVGNGQANRSKAEGDLKLGRESDVWSLGCILYQMIYGHPPFHHLKIFEKLRAIPDPKYEIPYPKTPYIPPVFLSVLKVSMN